MLLGLLREGEGVAAHVLISLGADLSRVRQQVMQLLSGYQGEESAGGRATRSSFPRTWQVGTGRLTSGVRDPAVVGEGWNAEVVRAGRTAAVCAEAFSALAEIVAGLGVELDSLDASRISITSVDTNLGPGVRLVADYRSETARLFEDEVADSLEDRLHESPPDPDSTDPA